MRHAAEKQEIKCEMCKENAKEGNVRERHMK
jgi:hypothetical protein